jgi:NSS family neurotransmitter:Na+ symporter
MDNSQKREVLGSRLGFILLSAGCAIGLGNVWRFPFITGRYGGAAFVLIYLLFLVILGLPVMVMELAIGRASKQNIGLSFKTLTPEKKGWHWYGHVAIAGNYVLMSFYVMVTGWVLAYLFKTLGGGFVGLDAGGVAGVFGEMLGQPGYMIFWTVLGIILGMIPVGIGLQKGVEQITKYMMVGLFFLLIILAGNSIALKGAAEGLKFYLIPNFARMAEAGVGNAVYAAMNQAFFTLSLGIGSISIFGSYTSDKYRLTGESIRIIGLDTFVALLAGLIIFPAAFAFNIEADAGPSLLFITLPNIFNQMRGGRFWGALFFLFMSFAALSTVIAVFENIVSYWMDVHGVSRRKASIINGLAMVVLALPAILGFNVFASFQPLGPGSGVLDLEDFIVSSNILPIGAFIISIYTSWRYGWGWDKFIAEADKGTEGAMFPRIFKPYFKYGLPLVVFVLWLLGYVDIFGA